MNEVCAWIFAVITAVGIVAILVNLAMGAIDDFEAGDYARAIGGTLFILFIASGLGFIATLPDPVESTPTRPSAVTNEARAGK
jgi:hypothetical protein